MGLPWFVAATVLAMTHVNSLKMESETSAPGEKPTFLGVREQRVTQICIFLLVGGSVLFTSVLQRIPMPVLYGVFLYMGTSSLKGSQVCKTICFQSLSTKPIFRVCFSVSFSNESWSSLCHKNINQITSFCGMCPLAECISLHLSSWLALHCFGQSSRTRRSQSLFRLWYEFDFQFFDFQIKLWIF